jgi:predicted nucleotidyltransferase
MMPTHGDPIRPTVGLDPFGDAMTRNEVLRLLREHKVTLARRFGVIELALYGSFARDRGSDDSDVDILVRFDAPPDWRRYFGAQAYLEDLLGRPVDMATSRELRAEIRPYVEREAIDV